MNVKKKLRGHQPSSLEYIKSRLLALEMYVKIDAVLVGFDHDRASNVKIQQNHLMQHLIALHTEFKLRALNDVYNVNGIKVKIVYSVSLAKQNIQRDIERVLAKQRSTDYSNGLALHFQPAIYVLNPTVAKDFKYAYHHPQRNDCPGTSGYLVPNQESNTNGLTCQQAGPLRYDPLRSGAGEVMAYSFPILGFYPPKNCEDALVPDLAAIIDSAVQHLFVPGAQNLSLPEWKSLQFQVIHIYDALIPDLDTISAFDQIKRQIEFLKLKDQSIAINHYHVTFGNCDYCMADFTQALMIKTKRLPGADMNIQETEFLDSSILHSWLSSKIFQRFVKDNRQMDIPLRALTSLERIIPVFIFEITSHHELVLDDLKTEMSFPEMVRGVRTYEDTFTTGMYCKGNDIKESHADIYRQVLAAVLQTGWGVLPKSQRMMFNGEIAHDYRWSVGNNPFDAFSTSFQLSESLIAVSKRNYLLSIVSSLVNEALTIYKSFQALSSTRFIKDLLPKEYTDEFYIRGNLLRSKLGVGLSHISKEEFVTAHSFIQFARHDIIALEKFWQNLSSYGLKPVLVCPHARGHLNFYLLTGLGISISLVLWIEENETSQSKTL
eukprot:g8587.t1